MHLHRRESHGEVDRALEVFCAEYLRAFPRAGDESDHQEAQWHALAAVLEDFKARAEQEAASHGL